jgi:hypothetical protein
MRIWLDDMRAAPDGWIHVKTVSECLSYLCSGEVTSISLDHDLGIFENGREWTGYDVLTWIERVQVENGFIPPRDIRVHSANPVAQKKMRLAIDSIKRRDS